MSYLQMSVKRYLTHDALHQRRLTLAVLADKGHLLASLDGQVDVGEHEVLGVIALSHILANHGVVTTTQTGRELQMQG